MRGETCTPQISIVPNGDFIYSIRGFLFCGLFCFFFSGPCWAQQLADSLTLPLPANSSRLLPANAPLQFSIATKSSPPEHLGLSVGSRWEKRYFSATYQRKEVNQQAQHYRLRVKVTRGARVELDHLEVELPLPRHPLRVLPNGWQSWTHTHWQTGQKAKRLPRRPFRNRFEPYGDYGTGVRQRYPENAIGYGFLMLQYSPEDYLLFGGAGENLANAQWVYQPTRNSVKLIIPGSQWVEEGLHTMLNFRVVRGNYAALDSLYFGRLPQPERRVAPPATGWTSWYKHYTDITEEIFLNNLEAFANAEVPLDYFQLDDGYQPAVGDWLATNEKFPNGLGFIARAVRQNGYRPSIWLSPFVVEKKSRLYKEHPDWVLRDEKGRKVDAGFNPLWGGWLRGKFFALDIYNGEVRNHLSKVFSTLTEEYGFELLKLDFLYAAALAPPMGKSRQEVMQDALQFLNEIAGEAEILACGVPLAPSFGKVTYCRIGPDITENPDGYGFLRWARHRERPATLASLRNTLNRAPLNGSAFGTDPDVFLLRDDENELSAAQQHTLFVVNCLLGKLVFTSDNFGQYDSLQKRLYLEQFPHLPKPVHQIEWFTDAAKIRFTVGEFEYVALVNLGTSGTNLSLPVGHYFDATADSLWHTDGQRLVKLNPYQTRIFLKIRTDRELHFAGSNLHLFPGAEIISAQWSLEQPAVELHTDHRIDEGFLLLCTNRPKAKLHFRGNTYVSRSENGLNLFRIPAKALR